MNAASHLYPDSMTRAARLAAAQARNVVARPVPDFAPHAMGNARSANAKRRRTSLVRRRDKEKAD